MMYTLHLGDCLDILPTLPAQSVDAIIADPPYGTTACKWDSVIPFESMWKELKRIIKPRGAIVLFGSQPFTSALVMSWPQGFRYAWVWDKGVSGSFTNAQNAPLRTHEDVCVFSTEPHFYCPQMIHRGEIARIGGVWNGRTTTGGELITYKPNLLSADKTYGDAFPKSVVYLSPRSDVLRGLHPTQKPLALLEYLVETYTMPDDTVLDFTMGSGTTGEACIETGRDFIGIEKEQTYYDIAAKRLEAAAARMVQMELAV